MCSIEDCARIKLAELAMKEYGLLKDISYRTFLDNLERENQRREESYQKEQVIYGPQKYGEGEYFAHTFANLEKELKKKLDEEFGWSREEIKKALEQVRKEVQNGKTFAEAAQKLGTVETQRFDEEGGYRLYEEVADNVVSLVREESYEKWLDTAYREADLQIKNENVFKEVK